MVPAIVVLLRLLAPPKHLIDHLARPWDRFLMVYGWYMDGIWMVYGWDYGMVMVIMNLMKLDEDPFLKFIHAIFFDFDAML